MVTNESSEHRNKHISIHIDDQQVFAPADHMTGAEIRALHAPPIGPDRDLYLEIPGPEQDCLIGDVEIVPLKSGMHFFSAPKTVNPGRFNATA